MTIPYLLPLIQFSFVTIFPALLSIIILRCCIIFAYFIKSSKQCNSISYGGVLSAYMRFKYPNVIDAALAASAPIYMMTFKGSEREFFFSAVTQVRL